MWVERRGLVLVLGLVSSLVWAGTDLVVYPYQQDRVRVEVMQLTRAGLLADEKEKEAYRAARLEFYAGQACRKLRAAFDRLTRDPRNPDYAFTGEVLGGAATHTILPDNIGKITGGETTSYSLKSW